jgi:hypothetical protein
MAASPSGGGDVKSIVPTGKLSRKSRGDMVALNGVALGATDEPEATAGFSDVKCVQLSSSAGLGDEVAMPAVRRLD